MKVSSIQLLVAVWVGLLVLLALTTGSAYVPLGIGNTLINLAIATFKVALIAVAFMHLNRSDAVVRLAAGAAILFLSFLAFLSFGDFLTRPREPAPWTVPQEGAAGGGPYEPSGEAVR